MRPTFNNAAGLVTSQAQLPSLARSASTGAQRLFPELGVDRLCHSPAGHGGPHVAVRVGLKLGAVELRRRVRHRGETVMSALLFL
jgi:hypothetical protein